MLHSLIGFIIGYLASYYFTRDITTSRTIAIEVGMQNSGLSVALAVKFYVSIVALPAAIFSITQNIMASLLTSYWIKNKPRTSS
jgi:BASS family bile acid:Na+ symporter